jgi:cell division protein FtsI (penicillin-binding protein 3)
MKGDMKTKRLKYLALLGLGLAAGASIRLIYLQGFRHSAYEEASIEQAQEQITIDLPRAALVDRNGGVIAASIRSPSIYTFNPQKIQDPAGLARAVALISGESADDILDRLRGRKRFTWLARKLPYDRYEEAQAICSRFPGCELMEEWGRAYPGTTLAANLVGCVGTDGGLSGLESDWNKELQGGTREYMVMRDAVSTTLIPLEIVPAVDPRPPETRLTIDEAIQFYAEQVLDETVNEVRARTGVAIVLDPRSGDILAMAVRPTFDPNRPGRFPVSDWRNHAVLDAYEPGSTFKLVTLAAALDSGRFKPWDTVAVGNGTLTIGPKTIHDDEHPFKAIYTLEEVLAHSSNVGAAKIGMALGPDVMYHYIKLFGFGEPTALHMKGESGGLVRPPSQWSMLSLPSLSFGQEITVTPIQLALAYAAVASGGYRVTPKIYYGGGTPPPERILSAATCQELDAMLRKVVAEGTGKAAAIPGITAAGKTGTAQKIGHKSEDGRKLFIAYFAGYAPAESPEVVTLVMVDEPLGKIYGGAVAAPAWAKITAFALKRLATQRAPASMEIASKEAGR